MAVEEPAHRRRAQQGVVGLGRQIAILVVGSLDRDDQVAPRAVVADALHDAAAGDVAALERSEIDRAAIPDINGFGADLGGKQMQKQRRNSDHGARRIAQISRRFLY